MAFIVHKCAGFETGGLEQVQATTGTPTICTSGTGQVRTGTYALALAAGDDVRFDRTPDYGNDTAQGNNVIYGFAVYFSALPSSGSYYYTYFRDANVVTGTLSIDSSGDTVVTDANSVNQGTIQTNFTSGTWYYVEVYCVGLDSGSVEIFVDGTSAGSVTGDFYDTGEPDNFRLANESGSGITMYFDDYYNASGATATSNLLSNGGYLPEVIGGYNNTAEDATDQGSTLDSGTWANASEIVWNDSNDARYTGTPMSGHMRFDEGSRAGPGSALTGTAKLGSWWFRMWRGGGGGTTHNLRYGLYNGATDSYTTLSLSLGTSAATYNLTSHDTTYMPNTSSHYGVIGMEIDGNRDIIFNDGVFELLQVVAASSTQTVTLTTGIASLEAFGTTALSLELLVSAIASLEAFGTAALYHRQTITCEGNGIASAEAFGTPQLNQNISCESNGIASAEAFGTTIVKRTQIIDCTGDGIASTEAFGTAQLNQNVDCTGQGIASAEAHGTPQLNQNIDNTGIASAEAFGTAQLDQNITCEGNGIASAESVSNPSVVYQIGVSGIASAEAFGTPQLNQNIENTGIASAEAFGTHTVSTGGSLQSITCTGYGIASGETHGTPQLNQNIDCTGDGIASGEAFGTPLTRMHLAPASIVTQEAFGNPALTIYIAPSAIDSAEAFGTAQLNQNLDLTGDGIASAESVSNPALKYNIAPTGIASLEAFGNAALGLYILPSSIGSGEAHGTPQVNLNLAPTGIASGEAWGSPQLNMYIVLSGITSAEAFGRPIVGTPPDVTTKDDFIVRYRAWRMTVR